MKFDLITILGPTTTGKTALAAHLAYHINAEIISADSRQVYKHMDIGTGKDYGDYEVKGTTIPAHLIDIHEPGYTYNVFEFQQDFFTIYHSLKEAGKKVIMCGGTGMYIESITKGYKLVPVPPDNTLRKELEKKSLQELTHMLQQMKTLHNITDTTSKKRVIRAIEIEKHYARHNISEAHLPKLNIRYIGVSVNRDTRRKKITERLHLRLEHGMVDEVKRLLAMGISAKDLVYYGLEYKYITLYLMGDMSYEDMVKKLNTAIHQFAKRQMTWFRKMERGGVKIHWIDGNNTMDDKVAQCLEIIKKP